VAEDLALPPDVRPLGLPRRPRGVGWTGVGTGVVAVEPDGGLSELTVGVERLVGQQTPQVPVARPRGLLVAFWVTGGAYVQAGRRQELGGRPDLRLLCEDHRDTLENPLGAAGGGGGGGENGGEEEKK